MTSRLLLGYLAVTLLVLVVLQVPLGITYARNERQNLTAKVERDAVTMASLADDALERGTRRDLPTLRRIADEYRADTEGRVVVVGRQGRALVDTSPVFDEGRDFSTRPEFVRALGGEVATGTRRSETLGTNLLYVAVPVASRGEVHGAVRITYPTSAVDARIRRYWLVLLAIALVVLAVAAVVGLALARSITRPLRDVERTAAEVGRGNLDARTRTGGPPEVRDLGRVFNETTARLQASSIPTRRSSPTRRTSSGRRSRRSACGSRTWSATWARTVVTRSTARSPRSSGFQGSSRGSSRWREVTRPTSRRSPSTSASSCGRGRTPGRRSPKSGVSASRPRPTGGRSSALRPRASSRCSTTSSRTRSRSVPGGAQSGSRPARRTAGSSCTSSTRAPA